MLSKLRTRLTYANVMATVAVFIALGGSSYAAIKVTGKNVKNGSLTGADVRNESLGSRDVKNLRSGDFASGQLSAGTQGPKGDTGTQGPKGEKGTQGTPGSDAEFNGAAAGGALTGTYPDPLLAANSVTEPAIQDGAVRSGEIENGQVLTSDIGGGAVHASDLGTVTVRSSSGIVILGGTGQNGSYNTAAQIAQCLNGEKLIAGGGVWSPTPSDDEELILQASRFSPAASNPVSYIAVGGNDSGTDRTFIAQALCVEV